MKTCHHLFNTSVNKNVAANSEKEIRHETTIRNITVWYVTALWPRWGQTSKQQQQMQNWTANKCSRVGNRHRMQGHYVLVQNMWNMWHLKLNLICVSVCGRGSGIRHWGLHKLNPHIYRGCGRCHKPHSMRHGVQNGNWGWPSFAPQPHVSLL